MTGHSVDLGDVAALVVDGFHAAPAAVVGAAMRRGGEWCFGWGAAGRLWLADEAPRASLDTIFDLASLTKPVVALTLARAERLGLLAREQVLGQILPELGDTASGAVTLDLLSAHRAGLEPHRELFVAVRDAPQPSPAAILLAAANARRPECIGLPPADGFPPAYSDLGYMLLGHALAKAAGRPLDELVAAQVARPLELKLGSVRALRAQLGEPILRERVAPTENVAWRGGVLRAVVHDENAWALGGHGMAGHAGLFGDVAAVVGLGVAVLDALAGRRGDWLTAVELAPLVRRRPGAAQCAGFDRRAESEPACGRAFGPETFGHLGFTGTSLWLDPDAELVGALLTNRVHPSRTSLAIRQARPAAYDRLLERMMAR